MILSFYPNISVGIVNLRLHGRGSSAEETGKQLLTPISINPVWHLLWNIKYIFKFYEHVGGFVYLLVPVQAVHVELAPEQDKQLYEHFRHAAYPAS